MATTAHDEHSNSYGCCSSGHDHDHDHDNDVVLDPTLASCCERDQQQYEKAMALKRLLTAHDPTSGGVRLRQQLFEPTPADLAQAHQMQQTQTQTQQLQAQTRMLAALQLEKQQQQRCSSYDDDESDDSDSDEFDSDLEGDDVMDQVLAARRKELEMQMQLALRNAADGYGVVTETDLTQLLQDVRLAPEIPRVVLVTSASSSSSSSGDDAVLREMRRVATTFIGTKFAVARVRSGHDTGVSPRDVRVKTLPSVVAFRHGEQIDATALDARASVDAATLWEAQLVPWLSMCSVLRTARQEQTSPQARDRQSQSTRTADENDTEREPPVNDCGVENCRIRYGFAHEHVGSSQEARREVAAWRS